MPTAIVSDTVLDAALAIFDTGSTRLDICSALPTNFTEATSTFTLGNKTGITVGAPADGSPNGRSVAVSAITDGNVTGTGDATHYALTDGSAVFHGAGPLNALQSVTSGNTFATGAFNINFPDAA